VTSDPDIYRAAKLLIDQHGADAGLRVAERADQLLEAGDMIGAATWRRILKAIEGLRRGRREGGPVELSSRVQAPNSPSGGISLARMSPSDPIVDWRRLVPQCET